MIKTKKLAYTAILLSLALIIGIIENMMPPLLPALPYAKLGFSNVIILVSILLLGAWPSLIIVIAKSLILSIFQATPIMLLYSLSSGLVSYFVMLILLKTKIFSLPATSALSGMVHNLTQLCIAAIIVKNTSLFSYLSFLMLFGAIAGYVTGVIAFYAIKKTPDSLSKKHIE